MTILCENSRHGNQVAEYLPVTLTHHCNFFCRYCFLGGEEATACGFDLDMTKDEIFTLLDEMKRQDVAGVEFGGGEPLCRCDFKEIMIYAAEKKIAISMVTNGSLISEEIASFLQVIAWKTSLRIQVSLDVAQQFLNDKYRYWGSYRAALQALEILQKRKLIPELSMVLHEYNACFLEELLSFMRLRNLKIIHIHPLIAAGRAKNMPEILLSEDDVTRIMQDKGMWEAKYGVIIDAKMPRGTSSEASKNNVQRN